MLENFTIKVDGAERQIFMSFGLERELAVIVGDPSRVAAIFVDFELRDQVLKSLLTPRKKSGKINGEIDIDDLEIDPKEIDDLLKWAADYVMRFLVRAMTQALELTEKHRETFNSLESSITGSLDLASLTASSGPSE